MRFPIDVVFLDRSFRCCGQCRLSHRGRRPLVGALLVLATGYAPDAESLQAT